MSQERQECERGEGQRGKIEDGVDSVQVQAEEKHKRGCRCVYILLIKHHDYFAQELEKIEAELTSLGKLKSETQGWQKKVKPLSLLCKFLFTLGSFFCSFKKSGVFIH